MTLTFRETISTALWVNKEKINGPGKLKRTNVTHKLAYADNFSSVRGAGMKAACKRARAGLSAIILLLIE